MTFSIRLFFLPEPNNPLIRFNLHYVAARSMAQNAEVRKRQDS